MWDKFYSKNGLAAKNIAKVLIELEIGKRIPRVSDFCEVLSFGRGTIQSALNLLEEMKAIKLEARGHLGTFLLGKDDELLLEIAGIAPLVGSMPLPYSRKYEGLATGLVEAFESKGKRINLTFIRGGINRIESIRMKRCDFAVVSKLTAESQILQFPNLKIFEELTHNSYVSAHKVFLSNSSETRIKQGMKIGLDIESLDQSRLTFAEVEGMDVQLVHVNYMQLFDMLHAKQIDATIWNVDEKKMIETFRAVEFQSPLARQLSLDTSEAVIVIDGNREDEIKQKWNCVTKEMILKVQALVETGEKIPRY
ncbi:GntR family transcriptional regulator YhfZ [Peribacillus frigoritolerans]|uniref:GntR family transcriptional regulator YhfZ n=1 Tax=Peribacillus frigoritolerans TaxID=450367 RepID=UPI00301B3FA6